MAPVVRGGCHAPVQGGEETGQPPGERPRLWWCPAGRPARTAPAALGADVRPRAGRRHRHGRPGRVGLHTDSEGAVGGSGLPGASCLLLHDGPLTVAEICDVELRDADVAFLSSREGGAPNPGLPDETLDLAGALLISGYRQVIAVAWAVTDETAPEVVRHVYGHGASSAEPWGAEAPHAAVRALRDRLAPVEWAGCRYIGV